MMITYLIRAFCLTQFCLFGLTTSQAGTIKIELDPEKNRPGVYAPEGGTAAASKKGGKLRVEYNGENTVEKHDWLAIQLTIKEPIEKKNPVKKASFKLSSTAKTATFNLRGGAEKTITSFPIEKISENNEKEFEIDIAKVLKDKPEKRTYGGSPEIVYPVVVVTFMLSTGQVKGFFEISDLVLETE